MAAAEEGRHADMGYDGPSDYSSTLAHISAWSSAESMQTYPENAPDMLLLGGEVLVLDVALLPEPTVHASCAGSGAEGRQWPVIAMDAFVSSPHHQCPRHPYAIARLRGDIRSPTARVGVRPPSGTPARTVCYEQRWWCLLLFPIVFATIAIQVNVQQCRDDAWRLEPRADEQVDGHDVPHLVMRFYEEALGCRVETLALSL